jgi:hypothetical protein
MVNVMIKKRREFDKIFTKQYLQKNYLDLNKTVKKIAEENCCYESNVCRYLCKYNLFIKGTSFKGITYKGISGDNFSSIRKSARERNFEFKIDIKYLWDLYIKQDKKCALTGVDIILDVDNSVKTASLDRIDSLKGYTKDNVQWVHINVNRMKWDYTQEEFF